MKNLIPVIVKAVFVLPDALIIGLMKISVFLAGIFRIKSAEINALGMLIMMKKNAPGNWAVLKQTIQKSDARGVGKLLKSMSG